MALDDMVGAVAALALLMAELAVVMVQVGAIIVELLFYLVLFIVEVCLRKDTKEKRVQLKQKLQSRELGKKGFVLLGLILVGAIALVVDNYVWKQSVQIVNQDGSAIHGVVISGGDESKRVRTNVDGVARIRVIDPVKLKASKLGYEGQSFELQRGGVTVVLAQVDLSEVVTEGVKKLIFKSLRE